jgi:hypothetical protein
MRTCYFPIRIIKTNLEMEARHVVEISLGQIFQSHDIRVIDEEGGDESVAPFNAIHNHMRKYDAFDGMNGFARMQACRKALAALDRRGGCCFFASCWSSCKY